MYLSHSTLTHTLSIFLNLPSFLVSWLHSKWGARKDVEGGRGERGAMPEGAAGRRKRPIWPRAQTTWTVQCFYTCGPHWTKVEVAMWGSGVAWDRKSCHTSLASLPPHTNPTNDLLFLTLLSFLQISGHASGHMNLVSFNLNMWKLFGAHSHCQ